MTSHLYFVLREQINDALAGDDVLGWHILMIFCKSKTYLFNVRWNFGADENRFFKLLRMLDFRGCKGDVPQFGETAETKNNKIRK